MNERDWTVILASIRRGSCVPLIGPGVSTTAANGERQNVAKDLSRQLAQQLDDDADIDVKIEDSDNLELVAQCYSDAYSPDALRVEAEEFYGAFKHKLKDGSGDDAIFESLATLPFSLFISTRHDHTLEYHLAANNRTPIENSYNFRGDKQQSVGKLGSFKQPLVYRLLGSTSNLESLALTESELLDLTEKVISGNPALPNDLRVAFGEKSFLFLGCGIHNDYIRMLLHALGISKSGKPSFSPDTIPPRDDTVEFKRSVWFYRVGYKSLRLLDIDEREFIKELRNRWEKGNYEKRLQPSSATEAIDDLTNDGSDAPEVFVSYMSEDADYAKRVGDALNREGIQIWLDTEKLRGGDRWDMALKNAINSVDFFIVLLSKHLHKGLQTYVFREITIALARASMKDPSFSFIFPVRIDEEATLPTAIEEANIQAVSLGNLDADVTKLASSIKRQFAKLQRR